MTNQEAFDRVWQYFVVEGHPAGLSTASAVPVYRDRETGNRCAIGCLLPDSMELGTYDGACVRVEALIDDNGDAAALFSDCERGFLGELQDAHDAHAGHSGFGDAFADDLAYIAHRWGLALPSPDAPPVAEGGGSR
jgi:hypothetical protein